MTRLCGPGIGALGIRDWPPELFPYPLPDQHECARKVADALVLGAVGEELVAALFDDVRLDHNGRVVGGRLGTFRAVYGNRKGKPPRHLRAVA